MNTKEETIERVMDIVLEHCTYSFKHVTKEDVIRKHGDITIQMTRCVFVSMLMFLDYSKPVIAAYLHRSIQAINDILYAAHSFRTVRKDWTYLVSEADCIKLCAEFKDVNR